MLKGLKGTDWMSPLLRYYEKFEHDKILDFLKLLDIKYSADWIGRSSPTERIMAMVNIIKVIDAAKDVNDVFNSKFDLKCFSIDKESFIREIEGPVYGKGFARYLLLKLDYFYGDPQIPMNVERLSVEHILPQNPAEDSSWVKDFSSEERAEWNHKIGNLVLITGHKDSSLGRHDYREKKEIHFEKNINSFPNSLRVLKQYGCWTPKELADNHSKVLNKIYEHYGISTTKCV
ncbi:MAG: HNH endonuclease family protein [Methanothrix sp.]|nr:HNH endonuclease family protein [Methanothrix sp.]